MDKSVNFKYLLNSMTFGTGVLDKESPCHARLRYQPLWRLSTIMKHVSSSSLCRDLMWAEGPAGPKWESWWNWRSEQQWYKTSLAICVIQHPSIKRLGGGSVAAYTANWRGVSWDANHHAVRLGHSGWAGALGLLRPGHPQFGRWARRWHSG